MLLSACALDNFEPVIMMKIRKMTVIISYYVDNEMYNHHTKEVDQVLILSEDPVKENYVFKGWIDNVM